MSSRDKYTNYKFGNLNNYFINLNNLSPNVLLIKFNFLKFYEKLGVDKYLNASIVIL